MAKRGVKADAIREHIKEHPTHKAADIIKALAARRIKVSPNQVYTILSEGNGKAPTSAIKPFPTPPSNVESLFHAKTLIVAVGGIEAARQVLDTYEKLLA